MSGRRAKYFRRLARVNRGVEHNDKPIYVYHGRTRVLGMCPRKTYLVWKQAWKSYLSSGMLFKDNPKITNK